ncbi:type II toxin-antitoxin system VapC family toxin [Candidatus Daviesbacteria bacterium]|nr:type II toxin-antitoxin system VapC family toxin [Candidatus Daviesbacteria bacterium]
MNTPGIKPLVVVGDTDGLIAILHEEDANHKKAVETVAKLLQYEAQTVFPLTTITETITTLKRKLNKPDLAAKVVERITSGNLSIENVDTEMLNEALKVFDPKGSKRNTLFDALVAATAKKLGTKVIFSTDDWYSKLGFTLAVNLQVDY